MNYIDFKSPTGLAEARSMLKELGDRASPVAGSTLHVFLRDESPKVAVDILRLGLSGIRLMNGEYHIGATTTVSDLLEHRQPGWVLDRVAKAFVTQPIRNMATIGGSAVRVFPWSDLPIALLALNADLVITGDDERVMAAPKFFETQPFHHLQPGDLLTSVRVPALGAGQGFAYHKDRRTSTDFSRCTVAAWLALEEGRIADVRIAVGAAVPMPRRMEAAEEALKGARPGPAAFAKAVEAGIDTLRWKGLHGISDEFARHLASVLIVDVLTQAHEEAKGA